MTSAFKTALAYAHITGRLPKHIHLKTYMAARVCLTDLNANTLRHSVKEEYVDGLADHPFILGDKVLKDRGFRVRPYQHRTSHTIEYLNDEGHEGYITREGKGCWIWSPNGRGMATEKFDVI